MKNLSSGDVLRFYADRWLSVDEEDGQLSRELPATGQTDLMTPGE